MPIYPAICPQGHKHDIYAKVSGRHRLRCPDCGKKAKINFTGLTGVTDANTHFNESKGMARSESYPKKSVHRARQLIGGDLANCIRSDGRVVFNDSRQAQRYYARRRDVQRSCREKKGKDPNYVPEPD